MSRLPSPGQLNSSAAVPAFPAAMLPTAVRTAAAGMGAAAAMRATATMRPAHRGARRATATRAAMKCCAAVRSAVERGRAGVECRPAVG